MRLLFLQRQPCIRTLKYAAGLRSSCDGLHLGFAYQGQTLDQWYGTGDELFDDWWRIDPDGAADLPAVIGEFRPDIIHSHNLPDRLTVLAVELVGGRVPVIHDSHDLQSLRRTPYEDGFPEPSDPLALERTAVEGCTALVAVSEEMLDEIGARHRLPAHKLCFPNYALARDLPAVLPPTRRLDGRTPRLVYQGTLSTNGGHYDLRELFRAAVASGVELDVYPSRPVPDYEALASSCQGMRYFEPLNPRDLLRLLPDYDFGWAVFNPSLNTAHLDTVLPNKVFEYLGCGLPVLTGGHRAVVRLIHERGVGIDVTDVGDLADHLREVDVAELRRRVAAARFELTIEANIQRLVDLYKIVLSLPAGAGEGRSSQVPGDAAVVDERPAPTDAPRHLIDSTSALWTASLRTEAPP